MSLRPQAAPVARRAATRINDCPSQHRAERAACRAGWASFGRVLLKACLNGPRHAGEHPALPVSLEALAADAVACVRAGAGAIHMHPRDGEGRESLEVG